MNPDTPTPPPASTLARSVECAALFIVAPSLLALIMTRGLLFPAIWLLAIITLVLLLRDPTFPRRELWNFAGAWRALPLVLARFAIVTAALVLVLWLVEPDRLFNFPRERPGLWAIVMAAYPFASVFPQEVAFRAFFIHRYAGVFKTPGAMLVANALAFGHAHVIMHNWIAVGFSVLALIAVGIVAIAGMCTGGLAMCEGGNMVEIATNQLNWDIDNCLEVVTACEYCLLHLRI